MPPLNPETSIASNFPSAPAPPPAARRDLIHRLALRWIPNALLLLTLCALAVRMTVRDGLAWSAALFYISPWPLLFLAWPVLGWWRRRMRFSWQTAAAGLAVTVAGWWLQPGIPALPVAAAPEGAPLKVMFWNIGHPKKIPAEVHELITLHRPQLLVLAEAEKLTSQEKTGFEQRHPGYRIVSCEGGLVAAVQGNLTLERSQYLAYRTRVHGLTAHFEGRPEPWHLVLADLGPWPLLPRTDRTNRILEMAGNQPRTLVIGDFNTPYESTSFDSWRQNWHHGLAQAPDSPGLPTWPIGLPLLAIDHVWMSRDLTPVAALKGTPWWFDHAWQIITIQPGKPGGS